jgi:putative lipoic acid-binding regulatory protein
MNTPVQRAESLLTFPVHFPVKVMGRTRPEFAQTMLELVQRHAPDFDAASVEMRASREGKYVSLTFTIHATSREQLDALYGELSAHPLVSMAL